MRQWEVMENWEYFLPNGGPRIIIFRQFKKMIAAVKDQDFGRAGAEMKDSRWYGQVGRRAETLVNMMSNA